MWKLIYFEHEVGIGIYCQYRNLNTGKLKSRWFINGDYYHLIGF